MKILIIGSGPIVVGSAAEFDYAGTQGCLALKELGHKVVLINSNPATIMTDSKVADTIYIEPLNATTVRKIIAKERPDALLACLGGQIALNIATQLADEGFLKRFNVEILGTSIESIKLAEDRQKFREFMLELGLNVPESIIANSLEDGLKFANSVGYPLIIRPAFTMGGSGGGSAENEAELTKILSSGLALSPLKQCLIERSISGLIELEYEVMRDKFDNAILICDMQNIDPVGIHTGDSAVIAPAVFIEPSEQKRLQEIALKLIKAFKIIGGCNVQLAYNPKTKEHFIIELNPRVSRSSALASKATSFAIAKITAKLALGANLNELINPASNEPYKNFIPNINYIVSKLPRFAFDKLSSTHIELGTQMKSTGEVMALGRTFAESFNKALRSLDYKGSLLFQDIAKDELERRLQIADDERMQLIFKALFDGFSVQKISELTKIERSFIDEFSKINEIFKALIANPFNKLILESAKKAGISDSLIAKFWQSDFASVYEFRCKNNLHPNYASAGPSGDINKINYFYSSFNAPHSPAIKSDKKKVLVLGSGAIRIAQGIEFDYSSVHAIWALKELGYEAIIVNNNPETLSTDHEIADKLYFEPLELESILEILRYENCNDVIITFGGQGAIDLGFKLAKYGVNILGTELKNIEIAEDRDKFSQLLNALNIAQPKSAMAADFTQAKKLAANLNYPVLLRPSFVLGGKMMKICSNEKELKEYFLEHDLKGASVLIDEYLSGLECEVDVISDAKTALVSPILEHIEKAGVHSGDSMIIHPPLELSQTECALINEIAKRLALALEIKGVLNIQFVRANDQIYVLEANARASRTLPLVSKITGINLARLATLAICDETLSEQELCAKSGYFVKAPVFSFAKLALKDDTLGPQMKSTGEIMCSDLNASKAIYKALIASDVMPKPFSNVLFSINDEFKAKSLEIARCLLKLDFRLIATPGTALFFTQNGIKCASTDAKQIMQLIKNEQISLIINVPKNSEQSQSDAHKIRLSANCHKIATLTNLETAAALANALKDVLIRIRAL